jgi:hypothetical protein
MASKPKHKERVENLLPRYVPHTGRGQLGQRRRRHASNPDASPEHCLCR